MDYFKIAKESYAWYNDPATWLWGVASWVGSAVITGMMYLTIIVLFGAAIIGALAVGNTSGAIAAAASAVFGLLAIAAFFTALLIVFNSAILNFVFKIALKRRQMHARELSTDALLHNAALSILSGIIVLVPVLLLIFGGVLLASSVAKPSGPDSNAATFVAVFMFSFFMAFLVALYLSAKLCLAQANFWSRENCGAIEAIKLSLTQTKGKQLSAIASVFTAWVAAFAGVFATMVLIFGVALIPFCGSFLVLVPMLAINAIYTACPVFSSVEIYSQLAGARGKSAAEKAKGKKKK